MKTIEGITRRDFLVGAAAGAVGVAALGVTAGCSDNAAVGSASAWDGSYKAGAYEAAAKGRFGDIRVESVFSDTAITSITILKSDETIEIAGSAIKYIPAAIIEGQTLNVDTISGATFTSNAILNAVADCVTEAGGSASALQSFDPAPSSKNVTSGTYRATAHGHHSNVEVEVVFGSDTIDSVKILSSGETFNLSESATSTIPQKIVENQSAGVDTVTGATYTSRAIMSAVENCAEQASGSTAVRAFDVRIPSEPWSTEAKTLDTDVVVVGSGIAGIAAALSAQDNGARVILIDKLPYWGGISQTCAGGMVHAGGTSQELIDEYVYYEVNMPAGIMKDVIPDPEYPNRDLMHVFAENSYPDVCWLEEKGATYTLFDNPISVLPPVVLHISTVEGPQDRKAPDCMGINFKIFLDGFTQKGGEIILECRATSLIVGSDGSVSGVNAIGKDGIYTINSKAVVLAAGGFGASNEMIKQYAPAYENEINVTAVGNTGDGIRMATDIGADVYDNAFFMGEFGHSWYSDYEMIHPYGDSITPATCLFVNPMGIRVNSETPNAYSAGSTYVNPDPTQRDYYWAISTPGTGAEGDYGKLMDEQIAAGNENFITAPTLSELARLMKITPNTLRYTISRYNSFCVNGADTDYFKTPSFLIPFTDDGPWYAAKCHMDYFGTVGGLKINTDAAVLGTNGTPIKGLFAAGENANGGFFNLCYMAGRSVANGLTMGRIAGASAAAL
jgi:fumarate reductase flavoprotein subunit